MASSRESRRVVEMQMFVRSLSGVWCLSLLRLRIWSEETH